MEGLGLPSSLFLHFVAVPGVPEKFSAVTSSLHDDCPHVKNFLNSYPPGGKKSVFEALAAA